jgi:MFS family permease
MTMKSTPAWKDALALLSVRLVAWQLGLVAGVFALFAAWLRMPDASVLEVVGSGLLALLIVALASLGEGRLILHLAGRASTPARLIRGALSVIAGTILWFAWSALITHFSVSDELRAGYLNSRAPHQLRHLLTFQHILLWLGWIWNTIQWIGAGFIAVFIFAMTASARPLRAAFCTLRSVWFWLTLLLGTIVATLFSGALMAWLPLHGLWPEMFSLGVRLAIVVLFDGIVSCLFLATLASCARRADEGHAMSAGGPDVSQPRTVEAP